MPTSIHEQLRLSVYHVERTPYQSLRLIEGQHPYWAVSHVRAGEVQTVTRGERFRAGPGSVMVHPPRLPYSELSDTPGAHEWVVFEATVGPNLDLFRLHPVAPVVPLRAPQAFSDIFEALLQAWQQAPSPLRDLSALSLGGQLLTLLLADWQAAGAPPRPPSLDTPPDRFAGLLGDMADHLDQKLTREDLAARLHLHPASFDRAFRRAYGIPPMQMLRDLRLERARLLLESTDLTLASIAAQCGFEDAAYLSRVFRRRHGQTPGQYRHSLRAVADTYRTETSLLAAPAVEALRPGAQGPP